MVDQGARQPLPMGVREQIDAQCDAFEGAWNAGETPRLEDYYLRVDPSGRQQLLEELVVIELHYRRTGGERISDAQLLAAHPNLTDALSSALHRLRHEGPPTSEQPTSTLLSPNRPTAAGHAADPTLLTSGLHVRCPHCSHHVQVQADSSLESMTCDACGTPFQLIDGDRQADAQPLEKIGRFDLVTRLGMGGFGAVWKAHDRELDRFVAVKIPRKGDLTPEEAEQFVREARSAAQLRHPNIVPVHEVGRDGDLIFIVSDFVQGVTLGDWAQNVLPTFRQIAHLATTVADALDHAHEQGVIHRDLKPANILVDAEGEPFVMDFGLARRETGEVTMTIDGRIMGTPSYMSPEQARGESHQTDRRTDVYSMGVVLFRLLTGELPYRGNAQAQIRQRLREDAPDPCKLNRTIPRDLATICLKCLERERSGRYSTAGELRDELQRYMRDEPIHARPISRTQRLVRWARREPAWALAAGLTIFLAIAGPLTALWAIAKQQELLAANAKTTNINIQLEREKTADVARIGELSAQLDAWEGRSNPWELWPPNAQQRPLHRVLDNAAQEFDEATANLIEQLDADRFDAWQQACGRLGVAMLADELERAAAAEMHYEAAVGPLEQIVAAHDGAPRFRMALALCHQQLARLKMLRDRRAAQEHLDLARRALAPLGGGDPAAALLEIELELQDATIAGFQQASTPLSAAAELQANFKQGFPHDPVALYRAACVITQRPPLLASEP